MTLPLLFDVSGLKGHKMAYQDLYPDGYKYNPCRHLHLLFKKMRSPVSYQDTYKGKDKGYSSYNKYRGYYRYMEHGKANTGCKGIQTCGDGQRKEDVDLHGVYSLFCGIKLKGFVDHLAAYEKEESENYPMVYSGNNRSKPDPADPA